MARLGFIRGKLDIKLLILYILARVAAPIDFNTLTDLVMCDDSVDYFQYAECVAELIDSGHILQDEDLYSITDKGRRHGAETETSLSTVIRNRCDKRLTPLNLALKRKAQIKSRFEEDPDSGDITVHLSMSDDHGSMLSLSVLVGTPEDGQHICQAFSEHPDRIYNGILGILFSEHKTD